MFIDIFRFKLTVELYKYYNAVLFLNNIFLHFSIPKLNNTILPMEYKTTIYIGYIRIIL